MATTTQEMRITDKERELLRMTFNNNLPLLKLLRKIFLPTLEADMPLGQNIDLWLTIPTEGQSPEQIVINLLARNLLINHLEKSLQVINVLAQPKKTPEEIKEELKKNSQK